MKRRFQDIFMQSQYETLVRTGTHWKIAEKEVIKRFKEYDGE